MLKNSFKVSVSHSYLPMRPFSSSSVTPTTLTSLVAPLTPVDTHLGVTESQEVHREVGLNAIDGSRQSDSTEQQHSQDHIGHCGCDPHNLKGSHKVHTRTHRYTHTEYPQIHKDKEGNTHTFRFTHKHAFKRVKMHVHIYIHIHVTHFIVLLWFSH